MLAYAEGGIGEEHFAFKRMVEVLDRLEDRGLLGLRKRALTQDGRSVYVCLESTDVDRVAHYLGR